MKETVGLSDEAREDQWGVRSIDKVQAAAYRKERLVIFKEDRIGGRERVITKNVRVL